MITEIRDFWDIDKIGLAPNFVPFEMKKKEEEDTLIFGVFMQVLEQRSIFLHWTYGINSHSSLHSIYAPSTWRTL